MSSKPESPITAPQIAGCLLGLALGDAYGAPFEGGPLERLLWRWLGTTATGLPRWTDDTQMALDLAQVRLEHGRVDQDALAQRFAQSYAWRRGYGPATARMLKRVRRGEPWRQAATSVYPSGSFGNGAAMRAPVLALFDTDLNKLVAETRQAAEVTHAHPLGVAGAVLMALATRLLLQHQPVEVVLEALTSQGTAPEFAGRLAQVTAWLRQGETPEPAKVAQILGNGVTAPTSVVTAIYLALRHLPLPFVELLAFVRGCGGDVDTLGAMAGALWGAFHGVAGLPDLPVENRSEIDEVAQRIWRARSDRRADVTPPAG